MPSFRVTITVGALRPGVPAESVLPTAAAAASAMTTLEASDLGVHRGAARITVRFTADADAAAATVADQVVLATNSVAQVSGWSLTRRDRGTWYPLAV